MFRGLLVSPDHKALKEFRVLLVPRVEQVFKDRLVHKAHKVLPVLRAHKDHKVLRA